MTLKGFGRFDLAYFRHTDKWFTVYLIHDRDHSFDSLRVTAKAIAIEELLTAPRVERFIGSARRECFDHVIVFNEAA